MSAKKAKQAPFHEILVSIEAEAKKLPMSQRMGYIKGAIKKESSLSDSDRTALFNLLVTAMKAGVAEGERRTGGRIAISVAAIGAAGAIVAATISRCPGPEKPDASNPGPGLSAPAPTLTPPPATTSHDTSQRLQSPQKP